MGSNNSKQKYESNESNSYSDYNYSIYDSNSNIGYNFR